MLEVQNKWVLSEKGLTICRHKIRPQKKACQNSFSPVHSENAQMRMDFSLLSINSPTEISCPYHFAISWRKANQRKDGSKQQKHIRTHIILKKIIRKFEENKHNTKTESQIWGALFHISSLTACHTEVTNIGHWAFKALVKTHAGGWIRASVLQSELATITSWHPAPAILPNKCVVIKNKQRFVCREPWSFVIPISVMISWLILHWLAVPLSLAISHITSYYQLWNSPFFKFWKFSGLHFSFAMNFSNDHFPYIYTFCFPAQARC